jgi:hypothetical protein
MKKRSSKKATGRRDGLLKHGIWGVSPFNKAERKMDRKAMTKARKEKRGALKRARKG